MAEPKHITTPLTDEVIAELHAGDLVQISGVVYAARDAAHIRMMQLLDEGKPLPVDLRGQVIYYVGPSPPRAGMIVGSAGPTTASRMDPFAPRLMDEVGVKGMIGKGERGQAVREACVKYKGIYFAAVGGAGALIGRSIVSSEIVAYEDLGAEAIRRMEIKDFPAIVVNDIYGADLFEQGRKEFARASG